MAFRFGRQPFQFDASAFQEPMQGVTYQTPEVLPSRRTPSSLVPFPNTAPQSPQMRRFGYENEQMAEVETSEPDEFDFGQMFKSKPTFDATQRYIDALETRPDLNEYKPNMWQNIFGAMAGVGAGLRGAPGKDIYGSVERIRYGPYQRALQNWEGKMEGLGSGAEAEQKKAEVDTRWMTSMGNLYNQKSLAEKRISDTERGWANIDVKREAQQASIDKAVLSGWQVVKGVDGRVKAVNPRDPDAEPVDLGNDTGAELAGRRVAATENRNEDLRRFGDIAAGQRGRGLNQRDRALDQADARIDISRQGAATRERNVDSLITDRAFKQAATETETQLTPADEKTVKETALQDTFIANPRFRALIDPDTGSFYEDAADDPLYEQFHQYYTSRIAERMKPKTSTTRRRPVVPSAAAPTAPAAPRSNGLPTGALDFFNLPR